MKRSIYACLCAVLVGCSGSGRGGSGDSGTGGKNSGSGGSAGNIGGASGGTGGVTGSTGGATGSTGGATGGTGGTHGGTGGASGGTGGATGSSGTGGGSSGTGGASAGTGGGSSCQANTTIDAMNCGHCGRVCESGQCSDGKCTPMLVLDQQDPPSGFLYEASVSGGKVYELEYTTNPATPHFYVYSAPAPATALAQPSTGTLIQDVGPGTDPNFGIVAAAFDSSYIYEASTSTTTGGVSRKKLDGSEGTAAAAALFGLPGMDPGGAITGCSGHATKPAAPWAWTTMAVGTNAAYVAGRTTANLTAPTDWPCGDSIAIFAISPLPTTASTAATPLPLLDKIPGEIISDLHVAAGHLFWFDNSADSSKRTLFTAPVTGGAPVMLEDDVFSSDHASIIADSTHVYWTIASNPGSLRRAPLSNLTAAAATDVTEVDGPTEGLAIDDQYVYFMTTDSFKTVARVPKAGGDAETLGYMVVPPSHAGSRVVGLDDTYIYLGDTEAKIYRFFKTP